MNFIAALWLVSAAPLHHEVFTGSEEGFLVNATIVSGEKDAVLIDALFTNPDAEKLADKIAATKKNLTTIYVTHGHPDHYFGLSVLKARFPQAKIVALATTVEEVKKSSAGKLEYWGKVYGDKIAKTAIIPDVLSEPSITLEGQKLEVKGGVQGDDAASSYIYIPSTKTVIAGDTVFEDAYLWTAETQATDRAKWRATLDGIAALNPKVVVPGHQKAGAKPQPSNVAFSKAYLTDFDAAAATSKTSDELQQKMKAKYPALALPIILKIGADAATAK
jgi:glyoxylase-like metal-dependent hydrolase (beta-lactamase superfamily II)